MTDTRMIDLATKYASKLDQMFTANSFAKASMGASGQYKDADGVASVYFYNVDTSDLLKGHTSPQYTAANAVTATPIRKDVKYFYEISSYLSAVQLDDTAGALKDAGRVMERIIKEQYTPLFDRIAFGTAIAAAKAFGGANVVAYDATNVRLGVDQMIAALGQQRSYAENQTLFIPWSVKPLLDDKLFTDFHPVKNDSIINKGVIGRLFGVKTVVVPDDLFVTLTDTGVAPYAQATTAPDVTTKAILWDDRVIGNVYKMEKTYVITGKEAAIAGYDGAVLRGLFRPGAWVFDANGTKKGVAILQEAV
jgi:hypothetical protein